MKATIGEIGFAGEFDEVRTGFAFRPRIDSATSKVIWLGKFSEFMRKGRTIWILSGHYPSGQK